MSRREGHSLGRYGLADRSSSGSDPVREREWSVAVSTVAWPYLASSALSCRIA